MEQIRTNYNKLDQNTITETTSGSANWNKLEQIGTDWNNFEKFEQIQQIGTNSGQLCELCDVCAKSAKSHVYP